jgi:hypothetical protein
MKREREWERESLRKMNNPSKDSSKDAKKRQLG